MMGEAYEDVGRSQLLRPATRTGRKRRRGAKGKRPGRYGSERAVVGHINAPFERPGGSDRDTWVVVDAVAVITYGRGVAHRVDIRHSSWRPEGYAAVQRAGAPDLSAGSRRAQM